MPKAAHKVTVSHLAQHLDSGFNQLDVAFDLRFIAFVLDLAGLFIFGSRNLNILGNINHHRAGAARCGNVESLMDHITELSRGFDEIIMLGAVAGDANGIRLLKCI